MLKVLVDLYRVQNLIRKKWCILYVNFASSNKCSHFSISIFLQIKNYEKTECPEERKKLAREIYDNFIMKEMLSHTHVSSKSFSVFTFLSFYVVFVLLLFLGLFKGSCHQRSEVSYEK